MQHVFISYEHHSKDFVSQELAIVLKKANVPVWWDKNIPVVEEDWRKHIDERIQEAYAVILVITPEAMSSEYVTFEWSFALGLRLPLIPLVLKRTSKIHPRLEPRQRIDFSEVRDWGKLLDALDQIKPLANNARDNLVAALRDLLNDRVITVENINVFLEYRLITLEDIKFILATTEP